MSLWNGKAYAPGKAPAPALAPVSPDLAPTPQPVVPEYDSRFENENAAEYSR